MNKAFLLCPFFFLVSCHSTLPDAIEADKFCNLVTAFLDTQQDVILSIDLLPLELRTQLPSSFSASGFVTRHFRAQRSEQRSICCYLSDFGNQDFAGMTCHTVEAGSRTTSKNSAYEAGQRGPECARLSKSDRVCAEHQANGEKACICIK